MIEGKVPAYFADATLPLRQIAQLAAADVQGLCDRKIDRLTGFDSALDLVAPRLVEMLESGTEEKVKRGLRHVERFQRLKLEARRLDVEFVLGIVNAEGAERVERLRKETAIEAARGGTNPDGSLTAASMPAMLAQVMQIVTHNTKDAEIVS